MRILAGFIVAAAIVIAIIVLTRNEPAKSRDLARDACENILEQCEAYADPELAPEVPDIGACIRKIDSDLQSEPRITHALATCLADADSCEAIVGCGFKVGIRERLKRGR